MKGFVGNQVFIGCYIKGVVGLYKTLQTGKFWQVVSRVGAPSLLQVQCRIHTKAQQMSETPARTRRHSLSLELPETQTTNMSQPELN